MTPYLGSIVENTSFSLLYNSFKISIFKFSARNESVKIVYISLVMFTIMVIKRFLTNIGYQCVQLVREFWEFECHDLIFWFSIIDHRKNNPVQVMFKTLSTKFLMKSRKFLMA